MCWTSRMSSMGRKIMAIQNLQYWETEYKEGDERGDCEVVFRMSVWKKLAGMNDGEGRARPGSARPGEEQKFE